MSGEHQKGREAIDGIVRDCIDHQQKAGREVRPEHIEEYKRRAREAAIRHDRRK